MAALGEVGAGRVEERGAEVAEVSRTLVALLDGLQIQWLYEDGGFDMTVPVRAYVRSLRVRQ